MATQDRGFAHMDQNKQKSIASQGGKASQQSGNAHHFSGQEAKAAGHKGGHATGSDKAHMQEIGKKGGRH